MKKKQHCILNKQYTQQQYETLVPKIIETMREDGSWGEFFPAALSAIPYNRSQAQRYFPLTKEQVLAQGLLWHKEDPKEFPNAIDPISLPDICVGSATSFVVKSTLSGQPFRITAQEMQRCREFHVPLPRTTYEERMDARAKKLGGIRLYERTCAKTGKKILTTYPPESPFIIWDRDEYENFFQ